MALSYFHLTVNIIISLVALNILFPLVMSDEANDRAECTESIISISTCLQYAQGTAKVLTPDCCNNLKQVVNGKPKCLCLLIMNADTPEVPVKFNVSLAMSLPSACNAPYITSCIELLKLQPGSKDAQKFEKYAASDKNIESNQKSGASSIKLNRGGIKRWLGGKVVADMLVPYLVLRFFTVMVG